MRIGPIVCEDEGPGPTLNISSTSVITGPLLVLFTARAVDSFDPHAGLGAAAGVCALAGIGLPVSAATAVASAVRIRKARRSEPSGMTGSTRISLDIGRSCVSSGVSLDIVSLLALPARAGSGHATGKMHSVATAERLVCFSGVPQSIIVP